jgi:hypothetical protein
MMRLKTVRGSRRAIPRAVGRDIPELECIPASGIAQDGFSQRPGLKVDGVERMVIPSTTCQK